MPNDIYSVEDVQTLLRSGFTDWHQYGEVDTVEWDGLVLFNYNRTAEMINRWNKFERISRGLIFEKLTGAVVSRGFDKFFNYGNVIPLPDTFPVEATEKMDGTYIQLFWRDAENWDVATRHNFREKSQQARFAQNLLNEKYHFPSHKSQGNGYFVDKNITLMFELLTPKFRILTPQTEDRLVLIGGRDRQYGRYLYGGELDFIADSYGFQRPDYFKFETLAEIIEAQTKLAWSSEGWVVRFSDNTYLKFKGAEYMQLVKRLMGVNFKRTLEHVVAGTVADLMQELPDEFFEQVQNWQKEIAAEFAAIETSCRDFTNKVQGWSRKRIAEEVKSLPKIMRAVVFYMIDGKDYTETIYDIIKENHKEY